MVAAGSAKSNPSENTGLATATSRFSTPEMAMSFPGSGAYQSGKPRPAVPTNKSRLGATVLKVKLPMVTGAPVPPGILPRFGSEPVALVAPVAEIKDVLSLNVTIVA